MRARVPSAEIDDVLQISALHAIEEAQTLRDPSRVLPWLYRVHGNIAIDSGRKRASEQRLMKAMAVEAEPFSTQAATSCGCGVALARQLGARYASILNLVDVDGLPLPNAAQTLEISVYNAIGRLRRARKALKKRLLEHFGVSSLRACADCRCSFEGCCAESGVSGSATVI